MTTDVTCSGCNQRVPWPAGGVKTDVERTPGARRVTMTDLTSGRVFHSCR